MKTLTIFAAGMLACATLSAHAEDLNQRMAALEMPARGQAFEERFATFEKQLPLIGQSNRRRMHVVFWQLPPAPSWVEIDIKVEALRKLRLSQIKRMPKIAQNPASKKQMAKPSKTNNQFADDMITDMNDQMVGRGLVQLLRGLGFGAGPVACTLQTFGGFVKDGLRDGEKWTPEQTLGNLFILAPKNCIIPIDDLAAAKSPLEVLWLLGDAASGYIPGLGVVGAVYNNLPWRTRRGGFDLFSNIVTPPAPAVAQTHEKKERKKNDYRPQGLLRAHARK